jgi:hypothetical protein
MDDDDIEPWKGTVPAIPLAAGQPPLLERAMSLASEDTGPLARIAKQHNTTRNICLRTITRWGTRGIRGVKLELVRVGGRFYTSAAAIDRFLNAINAGTSSVDQPRSPSERGRASAAAAAELTAAGC